MSVRTREGFVRKSTWQVADVRRPLVSASHIIQAGNDLFVVKDEAYIMNTKKKEKSMFRKERYFVHASFIREGTTQRDSASHVHAWRSMQSIKLQTEESEGVESRSTATAQLFDGRRSERGRLVQANWSRKTAIG